MPIHDWTRVDAGLYHNFHQDWTIEVYRALNGGVLPAGYVALTDLKVEGYEPDVLAIRGDESPGGVAVADAPPRARLLARAESEPAAYARKANRVVVRHGLGPVVAVIEVVSPGNKDSRHAVQSFKTKAVEFLRRGVSLLLIDVFPPTPRDPDGLHQVVWDEFPGPPFEPRPADKPLTVASFDAGAGPTVYADLLAVGDVLPDPPLFLSPGRYVEVPLERAYMAAWAVTPQLIRTRVAPPDPGKPASPGAP
jgi:hypothetical protein